MDEKILIKSEMDKKGKAVLLGIPAALGAISALLFLILATVKVEYSGWYSSTYYNGFEMAFKRNHEGYLIMFILACVFFVAAIVALVIYLAYSKCELCVTEKNVKGKAIFGKEVVLPMYMVSAYSTRKLFSTISVATSSGMTKFSLIGNYAEIGKELSKMINERQENTENVAAPAQNSSMDDLVKLKGLLDAGVLTQEEFDAKKKQLLGL